MKKYLIFIFLVGSFSSCKWIFGDGEPQPLYTSVCGIVKNTEGEPLQDVEVIAVHNNKKKFGPTSTDSDGRYCLEELESGDYKFTFRKNGYEDNDKDLTVNINKKAEPLDPKLTKVKAGLYLDKSALEFLNGEDKKTIHVTNTSEKNVVNIDFQVSDDAKSWLFIDKEVAKATIGPRNTFDLTLGVKRSGLLEKTYNGTIIINGVGESVVLPVALVVSSPQAPAVKTVSFNGISQTSANLIGKISNTGGGVISEAGFYWSKTNTYPNQTDEIVKGMISGNNEILASIEGLQSGEIYYVRAYAKNSFGVGLGPEILKFTTSITPTRPALTLALKNQATDKISLIGKITNTGGSGVKITEYGFCYNLTGNPTVQNSEKKRVITDQNGFFSDDIENLKPDSEYKIRAYAINDINKDSVGYSSELTVRTLAPVLTPFISDFNPKSAGFDSDLEIIGSNFGLDTSKIQVVFFSNKRAKIKSLTNTKVVVVVPEGAKTGEIKINVDKHGEVDSKTFTYLLTPVLETIASLTTKSYLNDVYGGCNGNIYMAGFLTGETINGKVNLLKAGVYSLDRNNNQSTVIETASGYRNSAKSTALLTQPTQVVCYNNNIYITDQFDSRTHISQSAESFISIRKISADEVSEVLKKKWENNDFIHDMEAVSTFNGLLFADGTFTKVNVSTNESSLALDYDGFTSHMDLDQSSLYTMDLKPSTSYTQFTLNKRPINGLGGPSQIDTKPLINTGEEPVGMAIDSHNQWAYVMEKNKDKSNFILYKINIGTKTREIIYEGKMAYQLNDGRLNKDASDATFSNVSCFTYDSYRNALIFIDVYNDRNNVRQLIYK